METTGVEPAPLPIHKLLWSCFPAGTCPWAPLPQRALPCAVESNGEPQAAAASVRVRNTFTLVSDRNSCWSFLPTQKHFKNMTMLNQN